MEVSLTFGDGLTDGLGGGGERRENAGKTGLELEPQLVLWGHAQGWVCCYVKRRKIPAAGKPSMAQGDSEINGLDTASEEAFNSTAPDAASHRPCTFQLIPPVHAHFSNSEFTRNNNNNNYYY